MRQIVLIFLALLVFGCTTETVKHPDVVNAEVELLEDEGETDNNLVGMATSSKFQYISCTDSDAQDFYYKGTTEVEYVKQGKLRTVTKTDRCVKNNRVKEFYCEGKQFKAVRHTCPDGCVDGACIRADYCGDGVCQAGEDCLTCQSDCLVGECCANQTKSCLDICPGIQVCQNGAWGTCVLSQRPCDTDCDGDLECAYSCPTCQCINGEVRECSTIDFDGTQSCSNGQWDFCQPLYGFLTVTSSPYANLFIDGQSKGRTPWNGSVYRGYRDIRVQEYGYYSAYETVQVTGTPASAHLVLRRPYNPEPPYDPDPGYGGDDGGYDGGYR